MIIASHCFYVQRCRTSYLNPRRITRRLSGIHAAWHFWYAVSFGGESGLRKVGFYGTHPLTRRYVLGKEIRFGDEKN
ncbi:DUF3265 domain-containing protein [Vibrio vulnificus]|nr:DUF3265 domain-containing protein [Vibrio vulnificus]HAS6222126.1 DUF3265 domain-containing protein [Vibrio vulnificus]